MKVRGQNSCFESRDYDLPPDLAWNLLKNTIRILDFPVMSEVSEKYSLIIQKETTQISILIQETASGCKIIADAMAKGIRLFDWGQSTKAVDKFYDELERQITLHKIAGQKKYCPQCGQSININANFCEYCGNRI